MELLGHAYVPISGPNSPPSWQLDWIDGYAASAVANATDCLNSESTSNGGPTSSTGVML